MDGNGNEIEGKGLQHHWKRTERESGGVCACDRDKCVYLCDLKSLLAHSVTIWDLSKPDMGYPPFPSPLCFSIKQRRRECSLASFSTDYGVVEPIGPRLLMEGAWQRLTWGQLKLQHGKAQRGQSQGSRWGQWVFWSEKLYFSFTLQG